MQAIETAEIQISTIHHLECARLDRQLVENRDVVPFARRNVDNVGILPLKSINVWSLTASL